MTTTDLRIDAETAEAWGRRLFEFEYCPECHGDYEDHDILIGPFGKFFARCQGALYAFTANGGPLLCRMHADLCAYDLARAEKLTAAHSYTPEAGYRCQECAEDAGNW